MWLFYYFNFERNYDVLKSKSPYILLNKNINFNKNETESKMENPKHSFRETNLVLQLIIKNCKLKVKLWWAGSRERKKRAFFVPLILSRGNFFDICILPQWHSEYTYFYISLLCTLCCLFLKLVESLQCILNVYFYDVQINRGLHFSSSLWRIPLLLRLFQKNNRQENFIFIATNNQPRPQNFSPSSYREKMRWSRGWQTTELY